MWNYRTFENKDLTSVKTEEAAVRTKLEGLILDKLHKGLKKIEKGRKARVIFQSEKNNQCEGEE